MLTPEIVLDYVKRNLGFPYNFIEITDEDILSYIRNYALREFSRYKPYVYTYFITKDMKISDDTFRIPLEADHEILSIKKIIPDMSAYMIPGYQINPFPSFDRMPEFHLKNMKAGTQYTMSWYNFSFEFLPPDRIRIIPNMLDSFAVRANLIHLPDFSTIPEDWSKIFLDLALANVLEYVASIRSQFQNFSTPFGEIPVSSENMLSRASDIRSRVIETLRGARPDTFFMIG